jgi:hypothetical protein
MDPANPGAELGAGPTPFYGGPLHAQAWAILNSEWHVTATAPAPSYGIPHFVPTETVTYSLHQTRANRRVALAPGWQLLQFHANLTMAIRQLRTSDIPDRSWTPMLSQLAREVAATSGTIAVSPQFYRYADERPDTDRLAVRVLAACPPQP